MLVPAKRSIITRYNLTRVYTGVQKQNMEMNAWCSLLPSHWIIFSSNAENHLLPAAHADWLELSSNEWSEKDFGKRGS